MEQVMIEFLVKDMVFSSKASWAQVDISLCNILVPKQDENNGYIMSMWYSVNDILNTIQML